MTWIKDLVNKAYDLKESGDLKKSNLLLLSIIKNYPCSKKQQSVIYAILGGNYLFDLENPQKSLIYFSKSLKCRPEYETASLGKYISLENLDRDSEAIEEMFNFSKNYKIELYKDTLEELLDGLVLGFSTKWKKRICNLANENGVSIPDRLL